MIDVFHWRVSIGLFTARTARPLGRAIVIYGEKRSINAEICNLLLTLVGLVICLLLIISGDIETNPGPRGKKKTSLAAQSKSQRTESQPAKPVGNVTLHVFRKHQGALLRCFESSLTELAFDLCSKGLIPAETRDRACFAKGLAPLEQASILLVAVEAKIACDPNSKRQFYKFYLVINDYPHMQSVAAKLKEELLKKDCWCEDDGSSDTNSFTEPSNEEKITDGHQQQDPTHPLSEKTPPLGRYQGQGPSPIQSYITYLKATYHKYRLGKESKKPFIFHRAKKFINLALVHRQKEARSVREKDIMMQLYGNVDEITQVKTPLKLEEVGMIVRDDKRKPTQFILVEGAPGVGKTTMAWHLCNKWEEGELFQEWAMVVMLELRSQRVRQAKTLYDLLYHPEQETRKGILKSIERDHGEGLFLIFDGYDELSTNQHCSESVFSQLLEGELIPAATIMVTSRPLATGTLPDSFKTSPDLQHIEVVGFGNQDVVDYIKEACKYQTGLMEAFQSYLSDHPFVHSVMYNPLHCSIITELYILHWSEGKMGFAPKTLSQLYTSLVLSLLHRFLHDQPASCAPSTIRQLSDLPAEVSEQLLDLGKLAAHGIEERQYIFDNITCQTMGLLRQVEELYTDYSSSSSYSFLHLTLQEFLAALYWSCTFSSQQLEELITQPNLFPLQEFVNRNPWEMLHTRSSVVTHWPVLLFIVGLKKFDTLPLCVPGSMGDDDRRVEPSPCLYQLLFESQCTQLVSRVLTGGRYRIGNIYSKSELFVAGYSIAHSSMTCSWYVCFDNISVGHVIDSDLEMLSVGLHYAPVVRRGGKIDSLWVDCLSNSVLKLHPQTSGLTCLSVGTLTERTETLKLIPFQFPELQYFGFGLPSYLELSHLWPMITLLPEIKCLTKLDMSLDSTDINEYPLTDKLQLCPVLTKLMIQFKYVSEESSIFLTSLSPLLVDKLECLDLGSFTISSDAATAIASSLQSHHCTLHRLELRGCTIPSSPFFQLASAIAKNTSLQKIIFQVCAIRLAEAISLANALKENKTLEKVYLYNERTIGDEGAQALVQSLNYNTTIKKLILEREYIDAISQRIFPKERVQFN